MYKQSIRFLIYSGIWVGILLIQWQVVNAQNQSINYEAEYKKGKQFYEQGQYGLAMQVLKPLTSDNDQNAYVVYANFYYALAAYHDGQLGLARNMLLQVRQKYPEWEQLNLVKYWLTKIYLEQEKYVQAYEPISNISGDSGDGEKIKSEARAMKDFYIRKIKDQEILEGLLNEFPEDTVVARQLTLVLNNQSIEERNHELLDSLVNAYNFDRQEYKGVTPDKAVKKSTYNVAVFLPFMWSQVSFKQVSQSNNFVLDIYKGIKMAVADLEKRGVQIELHAFDTRRDSIVTANILRQNNLQNIDLIIGPLFPAPSSLVSRFSYNNKINMFNPLSSNPRVIGQNPFSFLVNPSYETIGRAGASFAIHELNQTRGTVIYGENANDSIMAHAYKNYFDKDTSRHLQHFVKVTEDDSVGTINRVILERDSTDSSHVFVASNQELIVANSVSAVARLEVDSVPIIGHGEWLQKKSLTLEQIERLGVYMLAPEYIDSQNPEFLKFREAYKNRFNEFPSQYVYRSYDMMLFLGKMLNQYGIYFQRNLNVDGTYPSVFYKGYHYDKSNDNQIVPVIKLEQSELKVITNIK